MNDASPLPAAFVLLGPTASGKTALALALARRFAVEIISVDSALVYRGMNIGTAKPSAAERAACPHHLIDILPPTQSYTAARFAEDATRLMREITARGRVPLLVGGTMLYFRTLVEGMAQLQGADAQLRAALDEEARTHGWPHLHQRLARLDPQTAARLDPHDAQRIQRALELIALHDGQPLAALHARHQSPAHGHRLCLMALDVPDMTARAVLHQRIEARLQAMFAEGLVDEVRALRQAYPQLSIEHPAMRCVGYRQAWAHLQGETDEATLFAQALAATRQLAKRQLTWQRQFRERWAGLTGFDFRRDDLPTALAAHAARFLETA